MFEKIRRYCDKNNKFQYGNEKNVTTRKESEKSIF